MKKLFLAALLSPLLFMLGGCPVGMDYSPGNPGSEKINSRLLGTWTCANDTCEAINEVEVKKLNDYSYSIDVMDVSEMYSLETRHLTGYTTNIGGHDFLYCLPEGDTLWYTYEYSFTDNNHLYLQDIGLKVKGVEGVTSVVAFRAEIEASLRVEGSLSNLQSYVKN